jgi:mannose-1-phosphate guanylyltransferase
MRAVLLAAGLGTRLRPLTSTIPKCLVNIQGEALLDIWLHRLYDVGIREFLVNSHYLHEEVGRHIFYNKYKKNIKLVYEEKLLGTGGTIINNLDFINGEECLVIHADNYCMADFEEFILRHHNRPTKCLMTMMVFKSDDPSQCGVVECDAEGVVERFHEKKLMPPSDLANGAIYIFSEELIEMLNKELFWIRDLSIDLIPLMLNKIYTYKTKEIFIDIGTPDSYKKANTQI